MYYNHTYHIEAVNIKESTIKPKVHKIILHISSGATILSSKMFLYAKLLIREFLSAVLNPAIYSDAIASLTVLRLGVLLPYDKIDSALPNIERKL